MIAKVTRGASGRGLIRYLLGLGRANEHTDQRVISAGLVLGGEALASAKLSAQEIANLGAALDEANDAYGTNPMGGHLYHLSLSLPPGDRLLSDDEWGQIAKMAMESLGFEGKNTQPAAWVAIGHGMSAQGNQHIHIAASLVRIDGSKVYIWRDRKTLSRVCAESSRPTDSASSRVERAEGCPG